MNVAVIGSGGREHALTLKISESSILTKLYAIPGNPGTETIAANVNIDVTNRNEILDFCKNNNIDLVVIGPEQPLVDGLSDYLRDRRINVFGPSQNASFLEGDKAYAKQLMNKYNIPTAQFEIFAYNFHSEAINYLDKCIYPIVIKAFGLAAGKGVLICDSKEKAVETLSDCFEKKVFGDAGSKVVIEEFLSGEEASIFAITDGEDYLILPSSQDHKQIFDGDKGKNTGGMGAYAPAPIITEDVLKVIEDTIIRPTINAMKSENTPYSGCLYCGLMITDDGPKVIEYNCRFGDPETQAVLPILDGDFLELLFSSAQGKINKTAVRYSGGSAVCVVAASGGYPGSYAKGKEIIGLEEIHDDEIVVFHAGTKKVNGKIVTSGGRVLGVTSVSRDNDLKYCKEKAYNALAKIKFEGIYFRKDISDKAFKYI